MLNEVERPKSFSSEDEDFLVELIESLLVDAVNIGEAIIVQFHRKMHENGDSREDHEWEDEVECPCGTIEMIIPADKWVDPHTILQEYYRKLQWLN